MLLDGGQKLPFSVSITSSWTGLNQKEDCEKKLIESFSTDKDKTIKAAFRLKEYINFKIKFTADFGAEEAKLIIDKAQADSEKIILYPGQEKKLAYGDFKWVPDEYLITVQIKNKKYYSALIVDPKNMNEDQLQRMRKEINDLVKGVIYDLSSSKNKGSSLLKDTELLKTELSLLDLLEDNLTVLINTLNDILKNPIKSLVKEYEVRKDRFKMDQKAVKWLGSNKSNSINNSVERPQLLYQKKMKFDLSNDENKWLLKIIDYIRMELRVIENKLKQEKVMRENKFEAEKKEIEKLKLKLEEMENSHNPYLFKTEKQNCRSKIWGKEAELEESQNYIDLLENYLLKSKKLMKQIAVLYDDQLYFDNNNFRKVKKPGKKLFKDFRYKYFYDFYQKLMENKSNSDFKEKNYEYKKTEKLYEYYIMINIIKVLVELGYDWSDQEPFKKRIKEKSLLNISSASVLTFESADQIIEIHYDEELDNHSYQSSKKEFNIFAASSNLQPDFRVDIYDRQKNHLRGFVVEVKYRSFDKLYNEKNQTNVFKKLTDYKDKIKTYPDYGYAVEKVLVTYPEDFHYYKVLTKSWNEQINFIQLSPAINHQGQFGSQEFKDEIAKLVSS